MQCPVDQTVLQMSERSGVEIDYCPTCRGVWLDRGELDKILDRAAAEAPASAPAADPRTESVGYPQQQPYDPGYQQQRYDPRYQQGYKKGYDPRYQHKKKKRSFLDDIFD